MSRIAMMHDAAGGKRQGNNQSKMLEYDFHTLSLLHVSIRDMRALLTSSAAEVRS